MQPNRGAFCARRLRRRFDPSLTRGLRSPADVPATAETRASTRAIQNLLGMSE